MGLRINTNIAAFDAHRNLENTSDALSQSMEKLSSGLRINTAADDAAGLGISETMKGQISGVAQASMNAQDGISLTQTADGSMSEIQSILQRIRDLAVQYSNGVYSTTEYAAITAEVTQLSAELTRMTTASTFNGIALLAGITVQLQIGANQGETVAIPGVDSLKSIGQAVISFATAQTLTTSGVAAISISFIDQAINNISEDRATLGAIQNRLQDTVSFLGVYQENLSSANSRITDVDMASEMTNFTQLQILQQSGTAMLAQANQAPQALLKLLQ